MSINTLTTWAINNIPAFLMGVVLTSLFDFYLKRPKLIVSGGGGGGGSQNIQGITKRYVRIKNNPGLFGVALGETKIFGKRIFNRIDKGIIFDRNPAHECRADLYYKQTKQIVAPLVWEQNGNLSQSVTLNSGEDASLMIFARENSELLKYFPYRVTNIQTKEVFIPQNDLKFDTAQKFFVRVSYQYGRRIMCFDVEITKDFINGRLNFNSKKGGGGSF